MRIFHIDCSAEDSVPKRLSDITKKWPKRGYSTSTSFHVASTENMPRVINDAEIWTRKHEEDDGGRVRGRISFAH